MLAGEVKAFIGLGGNFVRAVPERGRMEPAWRKLRLTVQIATKLNRSHLVHGEVAYLLPCLGRIEIDRAGERPAGGDRWRTAPAASTARAAGASRRADICGRSRRSSPESPRRRLPPNPHDRLGCLGRRLRPGARCDRARPIRRSSTTSTRGCGSPAGSIGRSRAREREWKTETGKAELHRARERSMPTPTRRRATRDVLRLMTLRSNDQFNTTIYGYNDRFRGVHGTRMVVLMHRNDIDAAADCTRRDRGHARHRGRRTAVERRSSG